MDENEFMRIERCTFFERQAREKGYCIIAGVDEAGRGPLAGPVVAAACVLPARLDIEGIDDSKKLQEKEREELYRALVSHPGVSYAVQLQDSQSIDCINILQATMRAMQASLSALKPSPDFALVDGAILPPLSIPGKSIVKGDSLCLSIAAASILAKVTRDHLMKKYHLIWPQYGFDQHKGYGTKRHLQALGEFGPCPIHRKTFQVKASKDEQKSKGVT